MARGEVFHVKQFTVEGMGTFPIDMLRYDRCWPRTGADAAMVQEEHRTAGGRATRHVDIVTHVRPGQSWPTIDRWRSYGWLVTMIDGVRHG